MAKPLPAAASALLLTAPGCPHCPGVKAALEQLREEGAIGLLEVVDVTARPERAATLGARSVPWLRLGEFILTGNHTLGELREWARRAGEDRGVGDYLSELLSVGRLTDAEAFLRQRPDHFPALLPLLANPAAPMQVRLGINALLESEAGRPPLQNLIAGLGQLATHPDHRVRADACHLLGLSHSEDARPWLEQRLEDSDVEVREIVAEALAELARMKPAKPD